MLAAGVGVRGAQVLLPVLALVDQAAVAQANLGVLLQAGLASLGDHLRVAAANLGVLVAAEPASQVAVLPLEAALSLVGEAQLRSLPILLT